MSDVKTMGSIADKLLSYVNTALVHDTNYQIAASMLNRKRPIRGCIEISGCCM